MFVIINQRWLNACGMANFNARFPVQWVQAMPNGTKMYHGRVTHQTSGHSHDWVVWSGECIEWEG